MKRTIKKQVWMNKAEAQDLQKKAKKACMTEARLIRMLLEGYNPPVALDDRFYDAMGEMRKANEGAVLYRKIDKTVYEINVIQSDNAKESAEDILVRLIANESMRNVKEKEDG